MAYLVKTVNTVNKEDCARPFVKWAGGKGQLLDIFKNYYPFSNYRNDSIKRYVEPFVGGGAVLFDILQKYDIEEAFIWDINRDLINAYRVIRNDVVSLIEQLSLLEEKYLKLDKNGRKEMYYEIRKLYNSFILQGENYLDIERAAQLIFLNRTCFNGLYRVNSKGQFNVPPGDYTNPTICDKKNLYIVSELLQKVHIFAGDYKESVSYAGKHSFFYLDPPYRPLSPTSNFTAYNEATFQDKEQRELATFFRQVHEKGAFVMLSNSDPKNENPDDNFFDELYAQFYIHRIKAKRAINSNGNRRGFISELLVTNYRVND